MHHDILGEIKIEEGDGTAKVTFGSRKIRVGLIPDDQPFETTVALAAAAVARLAELDEVATRKIAADLLAKYNGGWNAYDEVLEDGSYRTVERPKLSAEEFQKHFKLLSFNATGDSMIELFYDDGDLFLGHIVQVTSTKGIDFRDAWAALAG